MTLDQAYEQHKGKKPDNLVQVCAVNTVNPLEDIEDKCYTKGASKSPCYRPGKVNGEWQRHKQIPDKENYHDED